MNTRNLVIVIAAVALVGFAASALMFQRPSPIEPNSTVSNVFEESVLERAYSPSFGRYTPFHEGSDVVVRLLETARMQGVYEPVLEAILESQPKWAKHGAPQLELAFQAAAAAGLDIEKSQKFMALPDITSILQQDVADVKAVGVRGTPTFFVNGKPLPQFGREELREFVDAEVAAARANVRR